MKAQGNLGRYLAFVLFALIFLSACSTVDIASEAIELIPSVVANNTATPAPTATPSPLEEAVAQVADSTGIDRVFFLGLTGEDWINLGISLLFVLAGYVLGTVLAQAVLRFLVRRTTIEFEDVFLKSVGAFLRWLVVVITLQFATIRLTFISPRLKTILSNIYFVSGLLIVLSIIWKFIDFAEQWYRQKLASAGEVEGLDPVITMIRRVSLILLIIIGASILMARFGLNTSTMTVTIGVIGLLLSLAMQDTISDTISGFVILADRPFRVGDAIEVETIGDWGIVKKIGLRTTRILTYDNRVVIIPNSIIGKNLVINYTYPDPNYRLETRVRVAYGTDIKTARQVISEAIRKVEGVLPDESVEVLCHEMGESAMVLRVWWWIGNYDETAFVRDRVIEAVQDALIENGLSLAYPVRDLNLQVTPETMRQLSQAFRESEGKIDQNQPKT